MTPKESDSLDLVLFYNCFACSTMKSLSVLCGRRSSAYPSPLLRSSLEPASLRASASQADPSSFMASIMQIILQSQWKHFLSSAKAFYITLGRAEFWNVSAPL